MLKSSIVSPFILALMFVTGTILAAPLLQPTPIAYGESIQDDLTASQARDYMFQGTSGDIITIDLAAEFDGVLELVAPDDTILAFDDDSGVGLNPLIEAVTLPETGEYIIRVSSFASLGEGSFTLSLTRTGTGEPTTPDDAPTANVIPIGFAEATSGILEPGQSLRFTLDAQMGDVLTASVQSDFDAVLEVSGPTGEFIVFDDDSGGNRQPIIENITLPTTGLYTLVLSGFDEQAGGSYTLEIGPNPATTTTPTTPDDEQMLPQAVSFGDSVSDELTAGQDARFLFDARPGDIATVTLDAAFDGILELYAPDNTLIASDDDSGEGLNPLLADIPLNQAGAYTIIVSAFSPSDSGTYTLTLEGVAIAEPDDPPATEAQVIVPGETVGGVLASPDEVDQFVFNAQAGDVISVMASSLEWVGPLDLVMEITGPNGEFVATDDDGGWRLNPLLVGLELPTEGTYTIAIRSFAAASSGEYRLALARGTVFLAPSGEVAEPLPAPITTLDLNLPATSTQTYSFIAVAGDSLLLETPAAPTNDLTASILMPGVVEVPVTFGENLEIPETGDYMLIFSSEAGGAAQVAVSVSATLTEPNLVTLGEVAIGVPVSGLVEENTILEWRFQPVLSGEYQFTVNSEDPDGRYDPYVTVVDENGNVLAEDDDSAGRFDAQIAALPLEGGQAVRIQVSSFDLASGGPYELTVAASSVTEVPDLDGGNIQLGESARGELLLPGQQANYGLEVSEPGVYRLTVDGLRVPVVEIYAADGALVARGVGTLESPLDANTAYRISIFDRLNASGDFTLEVNAISE